MTKLDDLEFENFDVFNLMIPKTIPLVDTKILNPRNSWKNQDAYDEERERLAGMFKENFSSFTDSQKGQELIKFGPF